MQAKIRMKIRRIVVVMMAMGGVVIWLIANPASYEEVFVTAENDGEKMGLANTEGLDGDGSDAVGGGNDVGNGGDMDDSASNGIRNDDDANNKILAVDLLEKLEVKGRAPKTGYNREEFYKSWPLVEGCNLRQKIIRRELGETAVMSGCDVLAGEYDEPYTGKHLVFREKSEISKGIQIDHVVALSDAWQKGAQYMSVEVRYAMATDPLNLLAVDAVTNQKKSDGDAATWLPPNKAFRCQYVARQVSVKYKYGLWVTEAEKTAIAGVLEKCPAEPVVGV